MCNAAVPDIPWNRYKRNWPIQSHVIMLRFGPEFYVLCFSFLSGICAHSFTSKIISLTKSNKVSEVVIELSV